MKGGTLRYETIIVKNKIQYKIMNSSLFILENYTDFIARKNPISTFNKYILAIKYFVPLWGTGCATGTRGGGEDGGGLMVGQRSINSNSGIN